MRRIVLVFVLLQVAGTANAQVSVPVPVPVPLPVALPSPVISTYSNSIIDQAGNVLIFDVSYAYTTSPEQPRIQGVPAIKTRITVITKNGDSKKGFDFEGSFQVVGVGRRAAYAIVSTYSTNPTPLPVPAPGTTRIAGGVVTPFPISVNRQLVALNVIAGTLPSPPSSLPAIASLGNAEVKLSTAGPDTDPDRIALIESPFVAIPLVPTATGSTPASLHTVRLFTFDSGSFTEITKERIVVP